MGLRRIFIASTLSVRQTAVAREWAQKNGYEVRVRFQRKV